MRAVVARILIIEDNPANLELMAYLLRAFGHRVDEAGDSGDGIALARASAPHLIVCDLQLPTDDGLHVARVLRADARLAGVPLVAVSAFAMAADRERALAAGFDGYLTKPIDPEQFVPQLEAFLPAALAGRRPATER